jgi:hypothetical protein
MKGLLAHSVVSVTLKYPMVLAIMGVHRSVVG